MTGERPSAEEIRRRVFEDRPSFTLPTEPPEVPVAPRTSATVILTRDGPNGFEVFMLERHLKSDVFGGAFVFPGGTVDDRDCDPALAEVIEGIPGDVATLFDVAPERSTGFLICAIRETFEEAGVLLARDAEGSYLRLAGDERFVEARRALSRGEMTPLELARRENIRYAADALGYFARWITPEWAPRRYDVAFFVAAMPAEQTPIHDAVETTASVWVRPADALARARAGELMIIFPTRKQLESLLPYRTSAEVLSAAKHEPIPPVLPQILVRDGQTRVVLPDGTEHDP